MNTENIERLLDKWSPVLELPISLKCKAILLEPRETWISRKDGKTFDSFEEREQYDNE